jgi:hypothetical protein
MRHVPSTMLRRLADDQLAVPDRARQHLAGCDHCQGRSAETTKAAELASRLIAAPPGVGDVDLEWMMLTEALRNPGPQGRPVTASPRRAPRLMARVSVGTGAIAAVGVIAAGAAAATVLTTVYAPTHVAPVRVSSGDLRAIRDISGLGPASVTKGSALPSSVTTSFGQLTWTTAGQPRQVSTIGQARAMTHLGYTVPASLPTGVGSPQSIEVQPQVTATIRFSNAAGGTAASAVAGSTLRITAGPAIVVRYGSGAGSPPTLVIVVMRRPLAVSTGATTSELESFLLSQRGVPAGLAHQIRLLGNPGNVLPVPVPAGMTQTQPSIGGVQAVLVADPSGAASGVVWETKNGIVHGVAGLLDSAETLDVARQVG